MALNDTQIQILIKAKDEASSALKHIESALKGVEHQSKQTTSAAGGLASGFSNIGSDILFKGLNLVGDALSAVATKMIDTAKYSIDLGGQMELARVAMEGMAGPQAAGELLKKLMAFAKVTPFQTTDIIEYSRQLMAFGTPADQIMDKMQLLGDIAAGLGKGKEGFGSLVLAYSQIRAAGKGLGQDLNQLAQVGVPIKPMIAAMRGITDAELELGLQNHTTYVTFEEVDTALRSLTASGGKFFDASKKQSKTLPGLFSNITDSTNLMLLKFMGFDDFMNIKEGGIFWRIRDGAQSFMKAIDKAGDTEIFQTAMKGLQRVMDAVFVVFEKIGKVAREWFDKWGPKLNEQLGRLGEALGINIENGADTAGLAITGLLMAFLGAVEVMAGALERFNAAWSTMSTGWSNLMGMMKEGISNARFIVGTEVQNIIGFLNAIPGIHIPMPSVGKATVLGGARTTAWTESGGVKLWETTTGAGGAFNASSDGGGRAVPFDDGGIVPGGLGAPRLVMAHGGETILPTHKSGMAGGINIMQGATVVINNGMDARELSRMIGDAVVSARTGAY